MNLTGRGSFSRARCLVHDTERTLRRGVRRLLGRQSWPHQVPCDLLSPLQLNGPASRRILYLAALPLDGRWQRPQQLAAALAQRTTDVTFLEIFDRSLTQQRIRIDSFGDRFRRVRVAVPGRPSVFHEPLSQHQVEAIRRVVSSRVQSSDALLVQHPLWTPPVIDVASSDVPLIYDRIDWHPGLVRNSGYAESLERTLIDSASAVVFSAEPLRPRLQPANTTLRLIPNGVDLDRFCVSPTPPRPTVGYIGALAGWFDTELVQHLATHRPDWEFQLAGLVEDQTIRKQLGRCRNVRFLGELPYTEVSKFYSGISVLLVPFRVNQLTTHVDPVKMYEALACGRAVVIPELPAIERWGPPSVYVYHSAEEAVAALEATMQPESGQAASARRAAVTDHTWDNRAASIEEVIDRLLAAALESS